MKALQDYVGRRCYWVVAALTAGIGGTVSYWVSIWIVGPVAVVTVTAVFLRCRKRRTQERRIATQGPVPSGESP